MQAGKESEEQLLQSFLQIQKPAKTVWQETSAQKAASKKTVIATANATVMLTTVCGSEQAAVLYRMHLITEF